GEASKSGAGAGGSAEPSRARRFSHDILAAAGLSAAAAAVVAPARAVEPAPLSTPPSGGDSLGRAGMAAAEAAGNDAAAAAAATAATETETKPAAETEAAAAARLSDPNIRALEASLWLLDVVGLSRAAGVCRAWRERVAGSAEAWRRCVRSPSGVSEEWRAEFYLHLMFDRPQWRRQSTGRRAALRPPPGRYQECLARAEAVVRAAAQEKEAAKGEAGVGGGNDEISSPSGGGGGGGGSRGRGLTGSRHRRNKIYVMQDIDTDVRRTCSSPIRWAARSARGGSGGTDGCVAGSSLAATASAALAEEAVEAANERATSVDGGDDATDGGDGGSIGDGDGKSEAGAFRAKLRRVLWAFAMYHPRVTYLQGMNFVAQTLLEISGNREDVAFALLAGLCDRAGMDGVWCQGLHRLEFCFFALGKLLDRQAPTLATHLRAEGVRLDMFASRWFVTLFTTYDVFGHGTVLKVLDIFLAELWPFLFQLALAVLLELQPRLLRLDLEGIMRLMQLPRARLFGVSHHRVLSATAGSADSLCERIRADALLATALALPVDEETLRDLEAEYHL
ncbi:unnamed protein product, partial [Phaeothamnion confervicola]